MPRASVWVLAAVAAAGLMAGCQMSAPKKVPHDVPIRADIEETSGENPVFVTLKVDGDTKFANRLIPGKRYPLPLHSPEQTSVSKLEPGKHRIWWRIHKTEGWNKNGNGAVTIYAGSQVLPPTVGMASSKYVWPYFWIEGWVDLTVEPSAAARPIEKAPGAPAPGGPAKTSP